MRILHYLMRWCRVHLLKISTKAGHDANVYLEQGCFRQVGIYDFYRDI